MHAWSLDANQYISDEDDNMYNCRVSGMQKLTGNLVYHCIYSDTISYHFDWNEYVDFLKFCCWLLLYTPIVERLIDGGANTCSCYHEARKKLLYKSLNTSFLHSKLVDTYSFRKFLFSWHVSILGKFCTLKYQIYPPFLSPPFSITDRVTFLSLLFHNSASEPLPSPPLTTATFLYPPHLPPRNPSTPS